MDTENISNQIFKQDVCRCCLSGSGTWDLTAAYITEAGVKEVFTNILHDCFGVSLSFINEMDASHLICDACVNLLRKVSSFHRQIVEADKQFAHYWINQRHEIDETKNLQLQNFNSENNPESSEYDYDSDAPLVGFKKSETIEDRVAEDFVRNDLVREEVKTNTHIGSEHRFEINLTDHSATKLKNCTKQVSERRRIIVTCSVVLVETTACPFRHHKSWFRCFFCTKDFMEINTLRSHYSQSHPDVKAELKKIKRYPRSLQIEISNLECRHCSTVLTDIDKMARHFMEQHEKTVYKECIADYKVNSSPYACHLCDKQFHVFRTLTTHLNVHYTNCICDVCGKSFLNTKRLKVHKRTHEDGVYPCTTCGKVLKTKTSYTNHLESAHSKRIIKCQICFKPMKHYNARIKHMSEVHNLTHTFKCPFCDRVYNIKHYLATHIRQTHGHKNKKCKVCSMVFVTNHSLKKHMLKHTGERPYNCTLCSKSYARSYTLKEHMRSHTGDKTAVKG